MAEKLSLNTDNLCLACSNQLADILGSELNTDDEEPLSAADLFESPDFYFSQACPCNNYTSILFTDDLG